MPNFLFLRGFYDERTDKSLADDDDMWIHLFSEVVTEDDWGMVLFFLRDMPKKMPKQIQYKKNLVISFLPLTGGIPAVLKNKVDFVFARGGHNEYVPWIRACGNAHFTYYGAGCRYNPKDGIFYDLILCDSEKQRKEITITHTKSDVKHLIKPAARHFGPISCEKVYDVCYIANGQQAAFKGVQWVYDTVPEDISVLHLGYKSKFRPPQNVTRKRVDRKDMPEWINKCRIGICPYDSIDSAPRAMVEMLACNIPVVAFDGVHINEMVYDVDLISKNAFWDYVTSQMFLGKNVKSGNFSLEIAGKKLRGQIGV